VVYFFIKERNPMADLDEIYKAKEEAESRIRQVISNEVRGFYDKYGLTVRLSVTEGGGGCWFKGRKVHCSYDVDFSVDVEGIESYKVFEKERKRGMEDGWYRIIPK